MKKIAKKITMLLLFILFSAAVSVAVYGADQPEVIYNKSATEKGYITLTYKGDFNKIIKVQVSLAGCDTKYNYDLKTNDPIAVPLQMGDGNYTVYLLQNISDNLYSVKYSETFSVKVKYADDMYKISNPYITFSNSMDFYKYYDKANEKVSGTNDLIKAYYDQVVTGYVYDYDKYNNMPPNYVPVIDNTYKAKKGICSDFSTLVAGFLRAKGVPTRLIMGYAPEISDYHAWNQILIDGKWVTVDATYDSAYYHAGRGYVMTKDGTKFQVLKIL